MNTAIIISAYNRPESLKRLLNSIASAVYDDSNIPLVISVDKSDNDEVRQIAEAFEWKNGEKRLIFHDENMGLRNHILFCGDLASEYGSIILLEDDLYVSRYFYDYTKNTIVKYGSDKHIAGISLYSHRYNETARSSFLPLDDASDVFFMQLASSWGQCWTESQWLQFRSWYDKNKGNSEDISYAVPHDVIQWPETSWKKYFIYYLIENDLYFVYPRISLTTNFSDPGVHHKKASTHLQVPLQSQEKSYNLISLENSIAVYDAFCEIDPERLKRLVPEIRDYDLTVDLYGTKDIHDMKTEYVLTVKPAGDYLFGFGLQLKPHESNIIHGLSGQDIHLSQKIHLKPIVTKHIDFRLNYYYNVPDHIILEKELNHIGLKTLIRIKLKSLLSRVKRILALKF